MKTLFLILALAAAFDATAQPRTPTPAPAGALSVGRELKALDLSWHAAAAARGLEAPGRLLADDYRFELDAGRMLTKAQEVEAVRAHDPPFDFGAFKLSEVGVTVEGGRATVPGILTTRPSSVDKKMRPRYFYTRSFVRGEDRRLIITFRLVSLPETGR